MESLYLIGKRCGVSQPRLKWTFSTLLSAFNSLTLSPALCALLFKPHEPTPAKQNIFARPIRAFFKGFNRGFEWLSFNYGRLTGRLVRVSLLMLIVETVTVRVRCEVSLAGLSLLPIGGKRTFESTATEVVDVYRGG